MIKEIISKKNSMHLFVKLIFRTPNSRSKEEVEENYSKYEGLNLHNWKFIIQLLQSLGRVYNVLCISNEGKE